MPPEILQFEPAAWAAQSARLIQDRVEAILLECGQCSVMLTGGRSAERLYLSWAAQPEFQTMSGVRFYFGDERCVPPDHPESNYGLVMRSLFQAGLPTGCMLFRMPADDPDREAAASRYGQVLPEKMDVLLLGVGEDGHIASLFPGDAALHETKQQVLPVIGSKPPYARLTITPPVIRQAKSIFVLAAGAAKREVLARVLRETSDSDTLPASLVSNATWLLDMPLIGEND